MAEGEFHESLNLAALWNLPVVFCCENNLYAMGTALARSESQMHLSIKAASYEVPSWSIDGMDVEAVNNAAVNAIAMGRGGGPAFLEFRTYRFRAHSMYDPDLYRDKAEIERWKERDPIELFAASLAAKGQIDDVARQKIEDAVADEIDDAVAFAEASPLEAVEDLTRYVTSEHRR